MTTPNKDQIYLIEIYGFIVSYHGAKNSTRMSSSGLTTESKLEASSSRTSDASDAWASAVHKAKREAKAVGRMSRGKRKKRYEKCRTRIP